MPVLVRTDSCMQMYAYTEFQKEGHSFCRCNLSFGISPPGGRLKASPGKPLNQGGSLLANVKCGLTFLDKRSRELERQVYEVCFL